MQIGYPQHIEKNHPLRDGSFHIIVMTKVAFAACMPTKGRHTMPSFGVKE